MLFAALFSLQALGAEPAPKAEPAPEAAPATPAEPAPAPLGPPQVRGRDEIDVQQGTPETLRKRAEVYQQLRELGYRKGKRKGEFQVFLSYNPWEPRVFVHDDGWILTKRQPPRIHAPGQSFADQGPKRAYLWCLIVPTACISVGGWVVSDRKLAPRIAEVYDQTAPQVRALNDAVAREAMSTRLNETIPKDLEAIWARQEVPPQERRKLLFLYWDTRTDTPEGQAAREAIEAFLLGVVQTSEQPFSREELEQLNEGRSSREPLELSRRTAPEAEGE